MTLNASIINYPRVRIRVTLTSSILFAAVFSVVFGVLMIILSLSSLSLNWHICVMVPPPPHGP